MNKPTIGIRQADGSFYSIMDEDAAGKKRLILSSAKPQQASVKIDLFRSEDGTLASATRIGTLALDKPESDTLQEIELILDLDDLGRLTASAGIPGQPARQEFDVDLNDYRNEDGNRVDAPAVTDQAILDDRSLDEFELDSLDDSAFVLEEPDLVPSDEIAPSEDSSSAEAALDGLPELDDLSELQDDEPKPEGKTDREILDDDAFADIELDSLSIETEEASSSAVLADDETGIDALSEGFGELPADAEGETDDALGSFSTNDEVGLDDFSFDDELSSDSKDDTALELAELDAEDDELSPISRKASSDVDEFSMDEEPKVELSDSAHDEFTLDDLDLDSPPSKSDDRLDSLDDQEPWTPTVSDDVVDPAPIETPAAASKTRAKPKKPSKASRSASTSASSDGAGDKMALLISLLTLGLLVMTILVLLFLNMIKVSQPPQIKPEVMRWKSVPMAQNAPPEDAETVRLDFNDPDRLPDLSGDGTWSSPPSRLVSAIVEYRPRSGESLKEFASLWGLDPTAVSEQGSRIVW